MKLEYNLSENDLLQYTLYQFKNQGLIKKTIFKELLLIMIIFLNNVKRLVPSLNVFFYGHILPSYASRTGSSF